MPSQVRQRHRLLGSLDSGRTVARGTAATAIVAATLGSCAKQEEGAKKQNERRPWVWPNQGGKELLESCAVGERGTLRRPFIAVRSGSQPALPHCIGGHHCPVDRLYQVSVRCGPRRHRAVADTEMTSKKKVLQLSPGLPSKSYLHWAVQPDPTIGEPFSGSVENAFAQRGSAASSS